MGLVSQYGTVGTENGATLRDLAYKAGTRPGLVVSHGHGDKGYIILYPGTFSTADTVRPLANRYPTIGTDLSGLAHWGSPASVTKFGDAVTAIRADGASSAPIAMYLFSMGALPGLQWALANPSSVAAIAIGMGVVDLAYQHDQNVQGWATEIETAHGVTGTYAGNSTIAARDPMQNAAALTAIPMKFWYASDDTSAITARQQAFIAASGCQSVNLGAVGHVPTAVPGDQVLDFLRSYA